MGERVPRVVHLVWLGSDIPARLERLRADIAQHDPDLEVRVWRDDDLTWLRNHAQLLAEPRPSGKSNIARYELLLELGGMYLDADIRVHRSLAGIFEAADAHGLVVARQSRPVYAPGFIAAAPGHPALDALVAGIPASSTGFAHMSSPARTGPHYFTEGLLQHLRSGGSFHELPQHAIYPWYADEDPLPAALLPSSVIMSHEWAGSGGSFSWDQVEEAPAAITVPDRRSRTRRSGGSVRTRAAATPAAHALIGRIEGLRGGLGPVHPGRVTPAPSGGTESIMDGWSAAMARRTLRGSAAFLDLHPSSGLVAAEATRVLDRPGRAILVLDGSATEPYAAALSDPSVRCSVHIARCEPDDPGRVRSMASHGSPLHALTSSTENPPMAHRSDELSVNLADLIGGVPRFDLVRARADRMTQAVADILTSLTGQRRIARLLLVIDPMSVTSGIDRAVAAVAELESHGLTIQLAPWLIDGRGRSWREHLRVAARPFIVDVGA